MSTTPATSKAETPVFPAIAATAQVEIPLDQIEPSPWNRKIFDQQLLNELAASIVETNGVVQNIVLRPVKGRPVPYQIVAGERRWLASKIAREKLKFDRKTISATLREMTAAQAVKITLMENHHREDVHVLERCRTYKFLLSQIDDATGEPFTRESISEQIQVSYSVVCDILNADKAIPEVQQAAKEGRINSSLVQEISKYQPKQQEQIFLECFGGGGDADIRDYDTLKDVAKDKQAEAGISVRRLREWIAENIHIDLSKAPFDTKDEFLLKGVTSCVKCPKRTGSDPGLFAEAQEVKKGDTCTDPGCYDAKKNALVELKIAEAQREAAPAEARIRANCTECGNHPHDGHKKGCSKSMVALPAGVTPAGPSLSQSAALAAGNAGLVPKRDGKSAPAAPVIEVQKISAEYFNEYRGEKRKPDVLYENEYQIAKPGCTKEKKAIWVDGAKIGQFVFICAVKSCSNHGYTGGGGGTREPITFERKKEIWDQRVQFIYREELLKLIATKLPGKIGDTESELIAAHVMRTLPHRDHEKVGRILGLEDSDPEALELHMRKLKPEALMRFIVVCSLVEDLGVDQLAFGGPLDKESPLKIAAKAYKVDDDKLLAAAKSQLESKRPKTDAEKKQAQKKVWDDVSEKVRPKSEAEKVKAPHQDPDAVKKIDAALRSGMKKADAAIAKKAKTAKPAKKKAAPKKKK